MGKRIVLFNDLPGYGKVALAAMVPLFSRMGHFPYQVPTAVVSNTLDFGKFRIQDMTDYMRDTIKVWDELGFDPDCICTGFVLSEEQVELIGDYIRSRKPRMDEIQNVDNGRLVMVDPIMADGGKLYNGIGMERVAAMRKLVSYSDVMVPNMTEAGNEPQRQNCGNWLTGCTSYLGNRWSLPARMILKRMNIWFAGMTTKADSISVCRLPFFLSGLPEAEIFFLQL